MDRREQILNGVSVARDLVLECARADLFVRSGEPPNQDLLSSYENYRRHTKSILGLFVYGEQDVAMWTQVELYAGMAEPAIMVAAGEAIFSQDGSPNFTPPRVEPIRAWFLGGAQPVFATFERPNGDRSRHSIVTPNAGSPPGMDWAPVLMDE